MPTEAKKKVVDEIAERIQQHELTIIACYMGINVPQATELRRQLRENGVQFKIYKNTLANLALEKAGFQEAAGFMEGPTAWVFCDDPAVPAKLLKEFGKEVQCVTMNGGILSGRVVGPDQLETLASLPSQEVLLAQVVGAIAAPLCNLVGTLNALPRNLVNVLDQVRKQKEEQAAA